MTAAITTLTDDSFDHAVVASDRPLLVDFWAPGCAQCRLLRPVLHDIASEYGRRLTVATLDLAANPETGQRYEVSSVPTLTLFVDGQPVKQIVGAVPKNTLIEELDLGRPS